MQKLQLYIDSQRVELFKDETVSLTQTIQNVRDIKKVFTEFTQTFSVPASKTNNIIFEHYYNYNIINGFDARNKVAAKLELNNLPFKNGFISLQGVDLKNNLAHTYKITFFGNTVNLKDILGNDQLASLTQLDNYSLEEYNDTSVLAKLQVNPQGANNEIIAPLITHTQPLRYNSGLTSASDANGNLFYNSSFTNNGVYWKELKFALKLQSIIDAIEYKYSLNFSTDFFNNALNDNFNGLYMWLHRKKGDVDTTTDGGFSWTRLTDLYESYNVPPTANFSSTNNGSVSNFNPLITNTLSLVPTSLVTYSVRVLDGNGAVYAIKSNITGSTSFSRSTGVTWQPLPNGTYSVEVASEAGISFAAGGITWTFEEDEDICQDCGGETRYTNASVFSSNDSTQFNITQQIPKMKIIDFLSSMFQMFNLTSYVDNSGTIVVKTLDSYYAAGSSIPINIDRYLDTEKSQVNIALPFKNIIFGYKGLGTILAEKYNQLSNSNWGTLKYADEQNEFSAPAESYEIEIPFEHMQFERLNNQFDSAQTKILYGVFVDDNLDSYYGEPLIFYPQMAVYPPSAGPQTPIAFRKDGGTASDIVEVTTYNMPSNSLSLSSEISTKNINFNDEINEYSLGTNFTGTLFNEYYINYIKDVFNPSRRLTKVTAYLPMKIFYSLKLNDLIQLGQNNYKINSLTTNLTTGKTEFELLNYDIEYINQLDILLDALEARADYFENKSCTAETLNELKQIQ